MDTYVILRRSGWRSGEELASAAERSRQVGDEQMSDDIRWIRSYVLREGESAVGTVCIHRAPSIPDLLIAATAEISNRVVLHLDTGFDLIAAITDQPLERLVT